MQNSQPDRLKVGALCIGIDKYKQFDKLRSAARDAREFHERLSKAERCRSMLNLDVQNTADLGRFLRSGFKDLSRDSPQQVILFYAGHGAQLPTGEVYMIPGDCSNDDLSSLGSIDICALSISSALRFWSEAFKKDSKARLLIIFDACRKIIENFPVKAGYNVEQPSKPTEDIQLKQWALYMTCPSGSKTFDDSEFMKYLMHDIKGVFGINNELKEVLDHAANHCENVSEFNRYKIASDLRIVENGRTPQLLNCISTALEKNISNQELSRFQATEATGKIAEAIVVGHSSNHIEHFQKDLKNIIEEFMKSSHSLADGANCKWRICSLFLLLFLRYDDTEYLDDMVRNYVASFGGHLGESLFSLVEKHFKARKISSVSFRKWQEENDCDLSDENVERCLIINIVNYTVKKEIGQQNIESQSTLMEYWDTIMSYPHKREKSKAQILDEAEAFLNKFRLLGSSESGHPLLSFRILEKALESGSYVVLFRMTKISSIFFEAFLYNQQLQGSLIVKTKTDFKIEASPLSFDTWVSNMGWTIGQREYDYDWRKSKQSWVKKMNEQLQNALDCPEFRFVPWQQLITLDSTQDFTKYMSITIKQENPEVESLSSFPYSTTLMENKLDYKETFKMKLEDQDYHEAMSMKYRGIAILGRFHEKKSKYFERVSNSLNSTVRIFQLFAEAKLEECGADQITRESIMFDVGVFPTLIESISSSMPDHFYECIRTAERMAIDGNLPDLGDYINYVSISSKLKMKGVLNPDLMDESCKQLLSCAKRRIYDVAEVDDALHRRGDWQRCFKDGTVSFLEHAVGDEDKPLALPKDVYDSKIQLIRINESFETSSRTIGILIIFRDKNDIAALDLEMKLQVVKTEMIDTETDIKKAVIEAQIDDNIIKAVKTDKLLSTPIRLSLDEMRRFKDVQQLIGHLKEQMNLHESTSGRRLRTSPDLSEATSPDFDMDDEEGKKFVLVSEDLCRDLKDRPTINIKLDRMRFLESLISNYSFLTAIGELFDNSIQRVLCNQYDKNKTIKVTLNFQRGTFHLVDNGIGCSDPKEMLQCGSKRASTQELYDEGCTSFRRYLSGTFSRYGVGAKNACNALGTRHVVSSKTRDSRTVQVVEDSTLSAWKAIRCIRSLQEGEDVASSFCKIDIEGFKVDFFTSDGAFSAAALKLCLSNIRAMYYMYLEGEQAGAKRFVDQVLRLIDQPSVDGKRTGRKPQREHRFHEDMSRLKTMLKQCRDQSGSMSEQIDLEFEWIHQGSASSAPPHRLADSTCCLDRVLSDDAKDCFPIYVEIPDDSDPTKRSIATGAIFYFPNQGNKDTVPYVDELHGHSTSLDRRFMVFWMGRWLPGEHYVPGFMRYREGDKTLAPQRCYARTFGLLFVDRGIEPEASKWSFNMGKTKMRKLQDALDSKDLAKAYDYWLKQCHLKFDAEVSFEDENPRYIDAEGMSQHDRIIFLNDVYQVGDIVELYKESKEKARIQSHVGRIERFLQDKHFDLNLPTGEVELLLLASDNSMTKTNRFRIQNYSMRPLSNKEFEATRAKNEKQIVRSVAIEFRNHIMKAGLLPTTRFICKNSNSEVIQTNIPIKVTVASQDCSESFEVSNGHLSFPDKIVKKLATVAGQYTMSLEPAAGQTPFTCEPETFYITPAEMHKVSLRPDTPSIHCELGQTTSLEVQVHDKYNNSIDLQLGVHTLDILVDKARAQDVSLSFTPEYAGSIRIQDLCVLHGGVGTYPARIVITDIHQQKVVELNVSIKVQHGQPSSIQCDADWEEYINYQQLGPVDVSIQDASGNMCDGNQGKLVVMSPDLLLHGESQRNENKIRKGRCRLTCSCASSLFSNGTATAQTVVSEADVADVGRWREMILKQVAPVGVFHREHGFFQTGDCVLLIAEQELGVGARRKTRPKVRLFGQIKSIFEQSSETEIYVEYFSESSDHPRLLLHNEAPDAERLNPEAISGRCLVFHDSLRHTLDLDVMADNVFFCNSDEFPRSLQATLDVIHETETTILHQRFSRPLKPSGTPRRMKLFRSGVELALNNAAVSFNARHNDKISDLYLVAADETNQPCQHFADGRSNLKVEMSWMNAQLPVYEAGQEQVFALPPLHVRSNSKQTISVFSCAGSKQTKTEETRLFQYQLDVLVTPGEPEKLKISLPRNTSCIKAGDLFTLEGVIVDRDGYDIEPITNQHPDEISSFTFTCEDGFEVPVTLSDDFRKVVEGKDALRNITIKGSKITVRNAFIRCKPSKGTLKLGLKLNVKTGIGGTKCYNLKPIELDLDLKAGDPYKICVQPDCQAFVNLSVPSMAEYECDIRFIVTDSVDNNLSAAWDQPLILQVGKQSRELEKVSDESRGDAFKLSTIPALPAGEYFPKILSKRVQMFTFNVIVTARNSVIQIAMTVKDRQKHLEYAQGSALAAADFEALIQLHTEDQRKLDDWSTSTMPDVRLYCEKQRIPMSYKTFDGNCVHVTFSLSEIGSHQVSAEFVDSRPSYAGPPIASKPCDVLVKSAKEEKHQPQQQTSRSRKRGDDEDKETQVTKKKKMDGTGRNKK